VLAPGLLVVHDTSGGGEDDVSELTGRKELDDPLLELTELDVVAGADDTSLVEAGENYGISISLEVRHEFGKRETYRPLSWITILPERWSSTSSNSPM
jgi:hypothetical protein